MLKAAICSANGVLLFGENDYTPPMAKQIPTNIQTNPERMLVFRSRQALRKRRNSRKNTQRERTLIRWEGRHNDLRAKL